MKTLLNTILAFALFAALFPATAAPDLILLSSNPAHTQTSGVSAGTAYRVRNIGDGKSRRFKVRMWVSTTKPFVDDDDLILDDATRSNASIPNGNGGFKTIFEDSDNLFPGIEKSEFLSRSWRNEMRSSASYALPLAEDKTQAGNIVPLSDLLGRKYYFKACIVFENETECDPDPRRNLETETQMVPPIVDGSGKLLGAGENELQLVWTEPAFDNFVDDNNISQSVNFVSFYRIEWVDENYRPFSRTYTPEQLTIHSSAADTPRQFSVTSTQLGGFNDIGKRYSLSIESCHGVAGSAIDQCWPISPRRVGRSSNKVGAINQSFAASQGSRSDGILVEYIPPHPATPRYIIERCRVGSDDCVRRPFAPNPQNQYLDTDVLRGKSYKYTLFACDRVYTGSYKPGQCLDNDSAVYQFGRTNSGRVGLVDAYENDDSPATAKTVSSSTSQLRSFHTPLDDDWVRIQLSTKSDLSIQTTAFEGSNVDTVLSLYSQKNGALNLIDENDDGDATASFSQIETVRLDAGVYYVKSTHFKLIPDGGTDPIIPAPVIPNYFLQINIEPIEKQIVLSPIIDLLLSD